MPIKYQELQWEDVRKDVTRLNSELAAIIDELNLNKKYTLFKFKYPFGAEILKRSVLQLPTTTGRFLPLMSKEIDPKIQEALSYNFFSNPISLLLKNSIELFIPLEDRISPFSIVGPGKLFGAWKILDTEVSYHPATFPWGITAGARSVFMLPKISETISHRRLSRKFQLKAEKPNALIDQWEVFREIANHKDFNDAWEVEILFFSSQWFKKLNDPYWSKFKLYLLDKAWQGSGYWRNQFIWRLIFSLLQQKRNIKMPAYISDIVRHLFALSGGALPAFQPAVDDSLAPISSLQKVYVEEYGLKKYAPTIMQPALFVMDKASRPIYYSLQYPTSIEFSLKSSERVSAITEIHLVSSLLKKYLEEMQIDTLKTLGTPMELITKHVQFDYFHNEAYRDLKASSEIPLEDVTFIKAAGNYRQFPFPKNSSFFNGCIRISYEEN